MATIFSDKNISSIQINGEKYNIKSIPFQNPDGGYIPKEGEIVIETDDLGTGFTQCYLKVGDGINNVATLPNTTAPPLIGLTTGDQYFRATPSQVASALMQGSNALVIHGDEEFGVLIGFTGFSGSFDSNFPFVVAESRANIDGIDYTFRLTGNYTTNKWEFSPILSKLIGSIDQFTPTQVASTITHGGTVSLTAGSNLFTSFVMGGINTVFSSIVTTIDSEVWVAILLGTINDDNWNYTTIELPTTNSVDNLSNRLSEIEEDVNAFFKNADLTASAKDTLKEIQDYIISDAQAAAAMTSSINNKSSKQHQHTVSGSNSSSTVSVSVPAKTYSASTTKLSATQAAPTLSKSTVLGDGTTISITGNGLGTVTTKKLDTTVTPTTGTFVTGVTAGTATDAITALNTTTIKNPTVTSVSIPQYTFSDVGASKVTLGTAFSVPNVTGNSSVTVNSVKTNTTVTATNTTFSVSDGVLIIDNTSVNASSIATESKTATNTTLGTAFSIPNVTGNTSVTASKATAGTALSASSVTTSNVTVATGAKSTVATIPSVSASTGSALTAVDVGLVSNSTATDAVSVVTNVASGSLSASITPENISAVTGVTEGKITLATGSTGDITVATGITSANTTLTGSGTAAAQTWSGTVGAPTEPS